MSSSSSSMEFCSIDGLIVSRLRWKPLGWLTAWMMASAEMSLMASAAMLLVLADFMVIVLTRALVVASKRFLFLLG